MTAMERQGVLRLAAPGAGCVPSPRPVTRRQHTRTKTLGATLSGAISDSQAQILNEARGSAPLDVRCCLTVALVSRRSYRIGDASGNSAVTPR